MDLLGIADAVAAKYAGLAVPAGSPTLRTIKDATARPPEQMGQLPAVVVFLDAGDLQVGNQTRKALLRWRVQFYYAQAASRSYERDARDVLRWVERLLDAHATGIALGGTLGVAYTRTVGIRVGTVSYAGVDFHGAECTVETMFTGAWSPTA